MAHEIKKPAEGVEFSSLPWNLNLPDKHSYVCVKTTTGEWSDDMDLAVRSYVKEGLGLCPATTSLNYGTTVWEGLKCYRLPESGMSGDKAVVFRADRNYERMSRGAIELCLPMPSKKMFMAAIQLAIQSNAHLIPPAGDGMKLYVRPMIIGSGQQLGLYPSPEFTFLVYVSPTGNYFKSATSGLNLHLETKRSRAAAGGMGATKCSGNYAAALKPLMDCKMQGFMDNIFLELETYKKGLLDKAQIQEMSAANVFLVLKTGEIVTPSLDRGTILPGITRESIISLIESYSDELAPAMKESTGQESVTCSARAVTVGEFNEASEAFCTGTAAEMVPISRVATGSHEEPFDCKLPKGQLLPGGPVTTKLLSMLRESMVGTRVVNSGDPWIRDPFAPAETFCL